VYALLKTFLTLLRQVTWQDTKTQRSLERFLRDRVQQLRTEHAEIPIGLEGHWDIMHSEQSVRYLQQLIVDMRDFFPAE